jgi:hypothetical protein
VSGLKDTVLKHAPVLTFIAPLLQTSSDNYEYNLVHVISKNIILSKRDEGGEV